MILRYFTAIILAVALATVAAGGVSALNPTVSEAATAGGYVKKCGGGEIYLKADEKRTLGLHNKIRKDRKLPTLCVHSALQKAARAHSKDMIDRDYFSHTTKGGKTYDLRLKSFGYTPKGFSYYTTGENIAYGSGSLAAPDSIMRAWMNSPGHKKNILNRNFREVGIGTYTGNYKGYEDTTMYTADFGARRK